MTIAPNAAAAAIREKRILAASGFGIKNSDWGAAGLRIQHSGAADK
jgi:hypothetical protein